MRLTFIATLVLCNSSEVEWDSVNCLKYYENARSEFCKLAYEMDQHIYTSINKGGANKAICSRFPIHDLQSYCDKLFVQTRREAFENMKHGFCSDLILWETRLYAFRGIPLVRRFLEKLSGEIVPDCSQLYAIDLDGFAAEDTKPQTDEEDGSVVLVKKEGHALGSQESWGTTLYNMIAYMVGYLLSFIPTG